MDDFEYILYLKYAIFEGEDRHKLFDRKYKEIDKCGRFFWGYNSYDITPSELRPLIIDLSESNKKITALFSQTKTTMKSNFERGTKYSPDKKNWFDMPAGITTHGRNLSFVFENLEENVFDLNLYKYKNLIGKTTGLYLPDYLIYPIHKAIAVKSDDYTGLVKNDLITYTATLKEIVYVK